jgi:hypothetical protein
MLSVPWIIGVNGRRATCMLDFDGIVEIFFEASY